MMTKTEISHTPGPWKINELGRLYNIVYSAYKVNNSAVAECCGPDADANAHLIAAAPELLEATKESCATICRLCRRLNPQHANCTSCDEINGYRSAIAKAEVGS